MMESTAAQSGDGELFDCCKYLKIKKAKKVPDGFFNHVYVSEQNGIELGSVLEIEHEDKSGYWFASVFSSNGVLICLRYFGDDNDKNDFWLVVKSPRIHHFNWGSENNKKLVPPYPNRYSHLNPEAIKEKIMDCEHCVSKTVLQMKGAPIYNIFKSEMYVEIQDKEYPYRVWISKIQKNVGGRLLLKMQGTTSPEQEPFWLFYSNERVFPLGWAEQKGLPWRVMNLDATSLSVINSSLLMNVLKPKTPEQHSFKVGELLEVLNLHSLMVFYVGTIVKIYDNRYFKVEINDEKDVDKRTTFVATKGNPYLFNAGWASKHKFLMKPPSDWKKSTPFCWTKYVSMKNSKLALVDNVCKRSTENINVGMKLEAVDPLNTDKIRVATVKGFADHWIFLSFDRSSWNQNVLHVRSIYSSEIFPIGWCNKHKYILSFPKSPYIDCSDYVNCYYTSDIDVDFNESDDKNAIKYPRFFKGDVHYHYKKNVSTNSENHSKDNSIKHILNEYCVQNSDNQQSLMTSSNNTNITESNVNIKIEAPELDEEFHDALFLEEDEFNKEENISIKEKKLLKKEKNVSKLEKYVPKLEKNIPKVEKNVPNLKENVLKNNMKSFTKDNNQICVYFNAECLHGNHLGKRKISMLPISVGPGPVHKVLHEAVTKFVNLDYFPWNMLKKIKKCQGAILNDSNGIEMEVITKERKSRLIHTEKLLLPQTKKMAQKYCSFLCSQYGMCEYFMTTKTTPCSYGCNQIGNKSSLSKIFPETIIKKKATRRKIKSPSLTNVKVSSKKHKLISEHISKVAKEKLDWSNESLVQKYKYYLACIVNYEKHIMRLDNCFSEHELSIISEFESKKSILNSMDESELYHNTKSKMCKIGEEYFPFYDTWKICFENCYRKDPRFKNYKIDIGHFEAMKVKSNPKYWSPEDVFKYLSSDPFCKNIGKKCAIMQVDGIAFMLLNEEQLIQRLECSINLAIRLMCHIAEVKYVFLKKYCNV